jgi:predicted nicotinamide N-methyase
MTHGELGPVVAGFQLMWRVFSVPAASDEDRSFGMWVLQDPDAPLDAMTQQEFDDGDERMPYFGTIWASAESLVAHLLAGPRLDGLSVLDLGCGLGPCGFAAARRGATVTFFDWEPRALEIVALSASAAESWLPRTPAMIVGDWRKPPPCGPFDLILGADVLYEWRNASPVARFIRRHLTRDGEALITDPGRGAAEPFPRYAQQARLSVEKPVLLPEQEHGLAIRMFRLRRG